MINVVCMRWGSVYSREYVDKLRKMVDTYITVPHRFICVGDDVPLPAQADDRVPREWLGKDAKNFSTVQKIYLMQSDLFTPDPCLYLDLDIVIKHNINWMVDMIDPHKFIVLTGYGNRIGINTSVIGWMPQNKYHGIIDFYWNDFDSFHKSDQEVYKEYMQDEMCFFEHPERRIVDWRQKEKLSDADIILYKGPTSNHMEDDEYVTKHWHNI